MYFWLKNQSKGCLLYTSPQNGGVQLIKAYVPLAEMFGYSTDLRSSTQGRGTYSMEVDHYEPVPKSIQEKIAAGKAE